MRQWIDTHLHLLYPNSLHYDWTQSLPALQGSFSLEDYSTTARSLGITQTLHMEVDVREDEIELETALVAELTARPSSLLVGAISACRPEQQNCEAFIERSVANPLIHGFRRVLHVVPDEMSTTETFRNNLRRLTQSGHAFDVCVLPRQLPLATDLAKACPNSQLVLDHCGVPDIANQGLNPWKENIKELSELPNVVCKVSGVIAYGDATRWPANDIGQITADLRPFVEHVVDCFGWDRVVWGSDFPVCNLTRGLLAWKAVTDELMQGCTTDQIDAFAHGNARRIYRLPSKSVS
jgi:predicted TIM-barrel fold metal-dependent hydrolase